MSDAPPKIFNSEPGNSSGGTQLTLTVISLIALLATFWLANTDLDFNRKAIIFCLLIVFYLLLCAAIYIRQRVQGKIAAEKADDRYASEKFNSEIENRLFALEEANQFFGASLKPPDMFRLVASRVNELVPFADCLLFLADENETNLKLSFAAGANSQAFKSVKDYKNGGLAARALLSRKIQIDERLLIEKALIPERLLKTLHSAIAVPLMRQEKVFAVLELFAGENTNFNVDSIALLEAVSERIAPLFVNSIAFEQNLASALTDSLTNLPNERAFFLVLENQIAEATRFAPERPLAILTVDLKDFASVNRKYGHATGDRLLTFAGEIIKSQLRRMDFLARSAADEFFAVLPTAGERTAAEIIVRIEHAFAVKPFVVSGDEEIIIETNFGGAGFGTDGETAQKILAAALLRKEQAKNTEPKKVLWFPKEYVN